MRDIVLSIVVFGLLPVCLLRPWIGVLTYTWLGTMAPHKLTWGFAFDFPFAMLVGVATLAGMILARDRRPIPWNAPLALSVLLLGYYAITTLFAWVPDVAWDRWVDLSKVVLMSLVTTMFIYGRQRVRLLMVVIALSIGFYGFKGGIWSILTGGAWSVLGPRGSFIQGNTFLGLAFVMVIPILFALARAEAKTWLRRFFWTTAVLCIISAVFTYSRGALLGLAVTLPFLLLRSPKKAFLSLLLIPIAWFGKDLLPERLFKRADTIAEYQQDDSAMQRLQSWSVAINIALERPLTGAGFNFEYDPDEARWLSYSDPELRKRYDKKHAAHSSYFQILGQHGFIAFALFLLMLGGQYVQLSRIRRYALRDPEKEWASQYASALQIGLVGFMVSGAFISTAYFELLYIYIALGAILAREAKSSAVAGRQRMASTPLTAPIDPRPLADGAVRREGLPFAERSR